MNLDSICNMFSAKIIPIKSLVECIDPKSSLKKGIIYEVIDKCVYDEETIRVREVCGSGNYVNYGSFFPSRFKFLSSPTMNSGND